jgi:hypothetical protein
MANTEQAHNAIMRKRYPNAVNLNKGLFSKSPFEKGDLGGFKKIE